MSLIPFGEWMPDQPDFQNPGAAVATNVYPRTTQSYGPIASLASAGLSALALRCQGAVGCRDTSGNSYNFAGTATKLYEATSAASSWTDVTRSSGGAYAAASEEQWHFAQNGNLLIAMQISDDIQVFTLGSSSNFSQLASAAPKARYACVSKNFALFGNTSGGTADTSTPGVTPQRVWWPKIGDPTTWPTLGTAAAAIAQSDAQDIVGSQGWITGMVANIGPVDAVIFFEKAVFRAMYIGAPDIWGFWPANGVRGCPVPGSIQAFEHGVIYVGPDDIYRFDGSSPASLGFLRVAKTFWTTVDQTYLSRVCSALDPINKLYFLAYPSLTSGGGVLDTIIICNYELASNAGMQGRWSSVTPNVTIEMFSQATTFGYNVDNFTSSTGYTVDSAPAGPDSRLWTGNKDLLSAFDTTHTFRYFTGSNLAPTVETSESQLWPGRRSAPIRARPIVDGGSNIIVTPYMRNRIADSIAAKTASTMDSRGNVYFKDAEGYYSRFRLTMDAGSTFTHLQGVDIDKEDITESGDN